MIKKLKTVRSIKIAIIFTLTVTATAFFMGCSGSKATTENTLSNEDDLPTVTIVPEETSEVSTITPMISSKEEIAEHLYAEKIQEGAYIITHEFPWAANSLVIEMENKQIVLVDTPYTPEATKALIDWIKEKFGERDMYAINTGFHFDNLGGNQSLIENNIPIYGSTLTKKMIDERGEAARNTMISLLTSEEAKIYTDAYQQIPYIAPTEVFDLIGTEESSQILEFGQENLEVYYPGPSHSPDNLVVYFPDRALLFGGCMIKSIDSNNLGNTADADVNEWPNSVERVQMKYGSAKIVVPGHGAWGNTDLLEHTIDLCK